MQEPVPGISAVPDEANARYFHVVVAGNLTIFRVRPVLNIFKKHPLLGRNSTTCETI